MTGAVLVTGATGRIGALAAPHLAKLGHDVIAASRDGGDGRRAIGDLAIATVDDLACALEGADTILHLAGVAHRAEDPGLIGAVNRDGAARLAKAARLAGARRFIFASTVYAASAPGRDAPFTSGTSDPPTGAYGRAKREAETAIGDAFAGKLLILRFAPVLIGPPAGGLGQLLSLARQPLPLPFARFANRRSLASPATVLSALAASVTGQAVGAVPVADAAPVSTADIVRAFRTAHGSPARLFGAPPALVRAGAAVLLSTEKAAALCDDFVVDVTTLTGIGAQPAAYTTPALRAYAS